MVMVRTAIGAWLLLSVLFLGKEAMVFRERLAVRAHDVPLPGLEKCGAGLRIAHVSDFHFRRWDETLDEARGVLLETDYDLLVVTGDLSSVPNKWRHAASMCRRFFDGIVPPLGIYAVLGNHDRLRLARQPGLPFHWLHDHNVLIESGGSTLYLAGVNQSEGSFGDTSEALSGVPAGAALLLMAHYPSTVFDLPADQVGLLLSGHTHGGQIRLPGIGCLFTNDRIPTHMSQGLHRESGTFVHVSAGIGMSGPIRRRFRCPPEVTFLTLQATDSENSQPATGQQSPQHAPQRKFAMEV